MAGGDALGPRSLGARAILFGRYGGVGTLAKRSLPLKLVLHLRPRCPLGTTKNLSDGASSDSLNVAIGGIHQLEAGIRRKQQETDLLLVELAALL